MRAVDYAAIAGLLADSSRLAAGESVTIFTHDEGTALADALYFECYRRGAVPLTITRREEVETRVQRETAATTLEQPPRHSVALLKETDVVFALYSQLKDPSRAAGIPRDRMAAVMKAKAPVQEVLYDGRRRIIITDFPTPAQAAFYGVGFDDYHDAFWNAMETDYDALAARVEKVARFVEGSREVRIRSAKGTEVTLRIEGRKVYRDAGLVDRPGTPGADPILNLPSGEVCLAPRENGADGVAVFDFTFANGARVTDLEVRFDAGRATLVAAREGFQAARDFFAAGTGDPYVIAELGIGANPGLTRPCGSILMDEKIAGTVHLALGDNRSLGGGNVSSIHQDMLILAPEVTCDGRLLMAEGELKV